jgi:hypothetical protein
MIHRRRLVGSMLIVASAMAPGVLTLVAPGSADGAGDDESRLVLVGQTFAVPAGGQLRLDYELRGRLATATATTTTTTTTTTTLAPGPVEGLPDPGEALPSEAPAATVGPDAPAPADAVQVDEPPLPRYEVIVTSYEPVTLRSRVMPALAGATGAAVDSARFDLFDVIEVDADGVSHLTLDVVTATEGEVAAELELPIAGLYPIATEIRRNDTRLARHVTFIERLPRPGERPARNALFNLAVVATLEDPGPEPSELELVAARSRLREMAQLGEDLSGPLTVAIPPVIARSLDAEPELAVRLRDAFVGTEVIALPETQLDPSSAVAAGEAEAFTRELREGEDLLAEAFPRAAVRRSTWIANDPISERAASMLRDLGVQLVVTPLEEYLELDGALPPEFTDTTKLYPAVLPDAARLNVATLDPVNALLDPEMSDGRSATESAVAVFAQLVATRRQLPDSARLAVLSTDRLGIPDADVLVRLEQFVDEHPWFQIETLSFAASATDPMLVNGAAREITFPETAGPDISARSTNIATTRLFAATVASLLPADDPRPAAWNAELDVMLSTALPEPEVSARLDELTRQVNAVPGAIVLPEPFGFTLTGDSSEITLRLGNTGDTTLTVLIRSTATKLSFPGGDTTAQLVPGITVVEIPVLVRSNGTFPVTIDLLTPAGELAIADPLVLTARVNALTGLGQVLTGGALLVLATWWFSHFRARRRRQLHVAIDGIRDTHPSNSGQPAPATSGNGSTPGRPHPPEPSEVAGRSGRVVDP